MVAMGGDLEEKQAIEELILNYAWGIDSRDWTLFRSIFADELEMDFSSFSGSPAATLSAEAWVAGCQALLPGFDATQHVLTNFMINVAGETATARVYMQAEHFIANAAGDNSHTLGGYYMHRLRRTGAGWKIHGTTLTVLWNRGNRHVYELARQRVADGAA